MTRPLAQANAQEFTAVRTIPARDRSSPPLPAPFELAPLVKILGSDPGVTPAGGVLGLGMDYGAVAHLLYHLCKDRVVNANFQIEEPNVSEILGPGTPQGRAESEL